MTDILELSDAAWDGSIHPHAYLGMNLGLPEVAPGVRMWPGFGNCFVLDTSDGLVLLDTGGQAGAAALHGAVRAWTDAPLHTAIYTHGHIDHVFGVAPFEAAGERVRVVGHELVEPRFARYVATSGLNTVVNRRQFQAPDLVWPTDYRVPDLTYRDALDLDVGGVPLALTHGRGETDDATTIWLPDRGVLACGDFFIWSAPNAGNPQKVQRYALDWAAALRSMVALSPEVLLPGHGLPLFGAARIAEALTDAASLLETLHEQTLALMNAGAPLDEVLHTVSAPAELLAKPYLRPSYDEPEFVVHNIWRRYAGWYDGNPASLKPASRHALAAEVAGFGGGVAALAQHATELLARGEHRLAGHFAQLAVDADPAGRDGHEARVAVFTALQREATSTMARGVYGAAVAESRAVLAADSDPA